MIKKIIKRTIKGVLYFVSKSWETIKFLLLILLKTDLRNHIQKVENAGLITILANGPSLKDDLENIDFNEGDFCVVNDFYKSPWYGKIKPKYHVLADPLYFRTDDDIRPFVDAVHWNMKLIVPYYAWRKVDILKRIPNDFIEVIPYHSVNFRGFDWLRYFFYEKGMSMPKPQNVLVTALFNLINMGYEIVSVYGADHSWTECIRVNEQNQVCLTDSHFYDEEKVNLMPWRKATRGREIYKMHEVLRDLAQMFDSYHDIRKYADYKHCHILNYTKNSYIDAFERA